MGTALMEMGGGAADVLIQRGDVIPSFPPGPIYVCTRNDALEGIIDACPEQRKGDLVFLQNGMLQPFLDARGLGDNTQVSSLPHSRLRVCVSYSRPPNPYCKFSLSTYLCCGPLVRGQALMYFAVAKTGEKPLDGKTDVNPEGLTAACGKWAGALRTRLAVADCTCKVRV